MYRTFRHRRFWLIIALCLLGSALYQPATTPAPHLLLNELVALPDARTSLADADGDFSDWVELYNPTGAPLNMAGYALTDDPEQPQKWPLPEMVVPRGGYLLVFASDKDRPLHANFKLRQQGEFLGLYNVHVDQFVDQLEYPPQFKGQAYGRPQPDEPFVYLRDPTPGGPNESPMVGRGLLDPVGFSRPRGFYTTPFTLTLHHPDPAAHIRYTMDGSEPSATHGQPYHPAEPLHINQTTLVRAIASKPDFVSAPATTHSYIFLDSVLQQPPNPPGFPPTWGVHPVSILGHTAGDLVAADYEMDPQIVNHPRYGPTLKPGLQALPSLSLATDVQNFYIYANPRRAGRDWERPASMEFIDPHGAAASFQLNAGVRIQGGAGRWEFMPKHSFRLFFRSEYGATRLNHPLFPTSPVESFDTLVLRGGVDRSFAGHPDTADHRLTTYARDEWLRRSQIAMSGVGARGRFVHLYLNGLYWGLYNMVERPDAEFLAAYLGGEAADWLAVNHSGLISGDERRLNLLRQLAAEGELHDPTRYAHVGTLLDLPQFADYLILNWYVGNEDWPHNNWYLGQRQPDGKAQFFVWDGESIWQTGAQVALSETEAEGLENLVTPLFTALSQNADFRMLLADRVYQQLFNDGPLTEANAIARWQRLTQPLEAAIVAEAARWGDVRTEPSITPADWQAARAAVQAQMAGNVGRMLSQLRQAGYYPPVDPPTVSRLTETLRLSAPQGNIYYTVDGRDPRQAHTGEISPLARRYTEPLRLTRPLHVRARVWHAGQWSALHAATFSPRSPRPPPQLQITEVMYHPPGGNQFEFLELRNLGQQPSAVANLQFEGIEFTFPGDTPPLAPGAFLVLVSDAAAFATRYPGVAVHGEFGGHLANEGELLRLRNPVGEVVSELRYRDDQGWPLSPDGRGDSLVLRDTGQTEPHAPQSWRASRQRYGSPGQPD